MVPFFVVWRIVFCVLSDYVNRVPPKGSTRYGEVLCSQGGMRQFVLVVFRFGVL